MEDLKVIVASNIIRLRTAEKMTQAELGEKLRYSDKSVSKWERAEAIPDVVTLKALGDLFGVSVDYLLTAHDEWEPPQKKRLMDGVSTQVITDIAVVTVWFLALLVFVIFWIMGDFMWITFVYAATATLILLLILQTVWEKGRYNYYIIAALVLSLMLSIYFSCVEFGDYNWWQMFTLVVPAELIVFLSSRLKKKRRKRKEREKSQE